MKKPNPTREIFESRFLAAAEKQVSMSRYSRGFLSEVARSLKVRKVSVVQRWVDGSGMPGAGHLVKIYECWGISPNHLLGIER